MTFFLAALLIAAMLAVVFVLIKGLVNMAGTTTKDLEGEGPSERALKSKERAERRLVAENGSCINALRPQRPRAPRRRGPRPSTEFENAPAAQSRTQSAACDLPTGLV